MFTLRKKETPAPISTIPKDAIPFLEASDLLSPHKQLIKKLRDDSGASKDFFDRYYLPAIKRMAEILQLRPFGHDGLYAKKGGAIEVAIKRVALALKLRQGALLPLNCKPEEISHRGECWTYGVFAGALLREFGGQLLSVKIIGFSKTDKAKGEWHGWYEPLTAHHHYRMKKHYDVSRSLSQTSSIIHLTDIIPPHGLEWLYGDKELMDNLLDLLAGANKIRDNPIQHLIVKASVTLKDDISFEQAEKVIQTTMAKEKSQSEEKIDIETGEVIQAEQTPEQDNITNEQTVEPETEPQPKETEEEPIPEPSNEPENKSSKAREFLNLVRQDIADKRMDKNQGYIEDGFIHIMYPSTFRSYTDSPVTLLNELQDIGAVVKEMDRKGKSVDRKLILK